ncbi:MAG: hypothetical protein FWE42_08700 [Defluviitaleaceae bacterium]|nr:hypothetical protein [Defluviitaleaceae bacterium]
MDSKSKNTNESTGLTGTLETSNNSMDWMDKSVGAKVQNPNQNKEIHKQALGPNARR